MNKIKNIIIDLIVICLIFGSVLFVYNYIDSITSFFVSLVSYNRKIVLNDPNEFKRDFKYEAFSNDEDYMPANKNNILNIYYNVLNNGWDSFYFFCPVEYKNCVNDVSQISNNSITLSNINGYINPLNSFATIDTNVNSLGEVKIEITKSYSPEEIENIKKEIKKISSELDLEHLTNREKIVKVHNYIIDNVNYDNDYIDKVTKDTSPSKATGALFNQKAICSGYADLFALLMDEANIPNIKVASDNHIWNLVYIDNEWKHIDVTWDDPNSNNNVNRNAFLLISTKKLLTLDKEEHIFDETFYVEAM